MKVKPRNCWRNTVKTSLAAVLVWVADQPVWCQGQISVINRSPLGTIDAPVFDTDCQTRLEGPLFVAQAYVGFTADSLRPVGPVINFRTGERAGYITPTLVTIPDAPHGTRIYFQLRAWEAREGTSFEEAVASGGKYGMSNIVPMRAWEPPGTPADPIGLQSFCLVPEPPPGVLLALGGGLWLLAARRREVQGLGRPGGRLSRRRTRGRLLGHLRGSRRYQVLDHSGICGERPCSTC
jgi:hypothetical protein